MKTSIKYLWAIACVCISVCLFSCDDSDNVMDLTVCTCDVFLYDKSGNSLLEPSVDGALDADKISVLTDELGLLTVDVVKLPENTATCVSIEYLKNKEKTFEFTIDWGNGWQDTVFIDHKGEKRKLYVNGKAHSFVRDGWHEIQLVRE